MRRWVWRVLLLAAAVAALTVGASAADNIVTENGIQYNLTTGTVVGPVKKDSLVTVTVKGSVNGTTITSIAKDAFNGCGKLRTVEIESNITTIEMSAFNSCPVLETVLFPDTVRAINSYAFANCVRLNKVVVPPLLGTIKSGTFAGCTSLNSIYIGSVTDIEADAFSSTKVQYLHCDSDTGPTQADTPPLPVHRTTQTPGGKTNPTCTKNGSQTYRYYCSVCKTAFDFSQDHPIPAMGHEPGPEIAEVPSTCSKDGTTAGHRCIREGCNGIADGLERIPKDPTDLTKHNATLTKVAGEDATCTKPGLSEGEQCPDCGTMVKPQTELDMLPHSNEAKKVVIWEATCSKEGLEGTFQVCRVCETVAACADCEKLKDDPEAYEQHITASHGGTPITKKDHTPGAADYVVTEEPNCTDTGIEEWKFVCAVCKEACAGDPSDMLDHPQREVPALGHDIAGGREEITLKPTCTEPGKKTVSAQACKRTGCGYTQGEQTGVVVEPLGHDLTDPVDKKDAVSATCKEDGQDWLNFQECKREGCTYEKKNIVTKRGAHKWSNPVADESQKDQDVPATCGKEGKSHVIVQCSVCDLEEAQVIALPATGRHNYEGSEWVTVKKPTATEDGLEERSCMNPGCDHKDSNILPATGSSSDPDDPGGSDKPSKPEEKPKTYQVTIVQGSNGTAVASRTTVEAGDRVTITASPNSGYELDMIRAVRADGKVPSLDYLGSGQYRFTMPASNVEVRVTFVRKNSSGWSGSNWASAPGEGSSSSNPRRTTDVMPAQNPTQAVPQAGASEQRFRDIPMGHWAAGEIEWANQMGYMNGTGGLFNPNWNITNQQMWMILARLTGANPASMAEARRWAVEGGYADGAAPSGAVKRHQLVTALYRCARLTGRLNQNTTSLAGYTDSRTVPAVARDAFSWALANGIVSGSADKKLMPNGNITRAQFAVILYRYSQRA